MASVVDTLVDMGFPRERAEIAVAKTASQDVQIVMDWLLAHENDQDDPAPPEVPQEPNPLSMEAPVTTETENTVESTETAESSETPVAKSIRCDDCGKLFKSNEEVEFHASKTGHENFSESTEEKKPLTEDEKKEQLAKIEAKLKLRRLEREAREKEEALLREKARIRSGKDLLEAKKKREEIEMKKIIEQRKWEKEEERLARQRVRDQIESDKLARKAKYSGVTQSTEEAPAPAPVPAPSVPLQKKPQQNYTEVKLQIRLIDGKILTQDFGVKEPLSAVRLYVEMNRTDGDGPFSLLTSFPKKVFTPEDYDKPLETLGLAPAATIIVAKSHTPSENY